MASNGYYSATGYNPNMIPYNPSRDGRLQPPPANGSNNQEGRLKGADGWVSDKAPEAGFQWNASQSSKGGKSRRYRKSNRKSNRKSRRRR